MNSVIPEQHIERVLGSSEVLAYQLQGGAEENYEERWSG